jgi:hypothetical protein
MFPAHYSSRKLKLTQDSVRDAEKFNGGGCPEVFLTLREPNNGEPAIAWVEYVQNVLGPAVAGSPCSRQLEVPRSANLQQNCGLANVSFRDVVACAGRAYQKLNGLLADGCTHQAQLGCSGSPTETLLRLLLPLNGSNH